MSQTLLDLEALALLILIVAALVEVTLLIAVVAVVAQEVAVDLVHLEVLHVDDNLI